MKKITFLLSLILSTMTYGQIVTNGDFQTGTAAPWYGNAANVVDQGGGSFVNEANITAVGSAYNVNISQVINLTDGLTYELKFDAFTDINTNTRTMIVGLGQAGAPYTASTATSTLTSNPQTFTYQFTINYGDAVNDRVIFDMGAALGFVFIDNVSVTQVVNTCNNGVQDGTETGIDCGGSCAACVASPTSPAPTPPNRPIADVKSIYSNSYTPLTTFSYTGDLNSYNPSWCPGNTTEFLIGGNPASACNKIVSLGSGTVVGSFTDIPAYFGSDYGGSCEGINFRNGRFDATTFTFFHIDIWAPIRTMFGRNIVFSLSNHDATNTQINSILYSVTNITPLPNQLPTADPNPGTWLSFDIPLSSFTNPGAGGILRNNIAELVFSGNIGVLYYDNVYLHKNTTLGTDDFEVANLKLYPNPASNVLNIESVLTIEKVSVYNLLGQEVISITPNSELVILDVASLQVGVYVVKTSIDGNITSSRFIKE